MKRKLPGSVVHKLQRLRDFPRRLAQVEDKLETLLQLQYCELARTSPRQTIRSREFKVFSQNGEDGVLLYLFSMLGTTGRTFLEIGVEDGRECNTANLSLKFGWEGVLLEGDPALAIQAQEYYRERASQVRVHQAFVTRENVNDLVERAGLKGTIDLLVIDIDGNDYWIWEALTVVDPRLVVMEYNASLGPEASLTTPYHPEFENLSHHPSGWYAGASLTALTKLAKNQGYVLVGCESNGVNAFFVKAEQTRGKLEPLAPIDAFYPNRSRPGSPMDQWARLNHLPFEPV